jgi:[Skp1-protein]-hydroxyproline N-acetylglucosaminyltransferase
MRHVIIILIILFIILNTNNHKEYLIEKFVSKPDDTIFISIASYRDDECPDTLKSIYKNAKNPDNIYIGICQQNKDNDVDCLKYKNRDSQIKMVRLKHSDAKGPTYARYICSTLWNGEEFYLQIDSHTQFLKNWDEKLIALFRELKNDKGVLTHYPKSKDDNSDLVPYMCKSKYSGDMFTFESALITKPTELLKAPFIAAGFLFLKGDFLNHVPFDPHLPYLFQGEELLLSARLWTNGYDFYTPKENICKHHYTRSEKPKYWDDHKNIGETTDKTKLRVNYLLGWHNIDKVPEDAKKDIDKFGMGKNRSLDQYWTFCGIDFKNKKGSDYCGKIYKHNKWVDFK